MIDDDDQLIDALDRLTRAVRAIAHGDQHEPGGLEALTMAFTGEGAPGNPSVADAVSAGLYAIAEATSEGFREVARAIRDTGRVEE